MARGARAVGRDKFVECEGEKGSGSPWRIVVAVFGVSELERSRHKMCTACRKELGRLPGGGVCPDLVHVVK